MYLVTIGWLKTTTKIAKVLRIDKETGFCDNTLQNALRDVGFKAFEKIPKLCLSQKNVQEKLHFAIIHKDWIVKD